MRRSAFVAALVAASLLTACATPEPAETASTPSASPSASAVETASAPVATAIEFDALGVRILDSSDQELLGINYFDGPSELISQLSAAFGHEPTVTSIEASGDLSATTMYDWGGFVLSDEEVEITRTFYVTATAARVGDVEIRTTEGFVVGMTEADLIASGAVLYAEGELRTYKAGARPVDALIDELPPGESPEAWMYASVPASESLVTSIGGPVSNAAG